MSRLSRTRAILADQRGYSLMEMLVALVLITLIMVPLMYWSSRGLASFQFLQAQSNTSVELSTLSQRMSKVIRGATTIVTAQDNTLTIYGYFSPQDTVVKRIRYFINGTNLNIGVTPPTGTAPNYTYISANEVITTTRVDLVMGSNPMFRYYDSQGTELPAGFAVSQVKAIGLYVAANPNPYQVAVPIAMSTRVTLRNFKTNL